MKAPGSQKTTGVVCLALVHHANQYVITNGYSDREGLHDVLGMGRAECPRGLLPLLEMHQRYQVPLNLHLSGTFIEALAWYHPESFFFVRRLQRARLLELVGSTFSQNVMPFFSNEHNLRQINEELWLYRRHLRANLSGVKTFWPPERVWDTERLAKLLRSERLLNGGYGYVLLDDRLVYPAGDQYGGSARETFDHETSLDLNAFMPWEILGGHGLVMLPISKQLRYLIPPVDAGALDRLSDLLRSLASSSNPKVIAIYGDDLEKAAGVGGWDNLHLVRYERLLNWLNSNRWIRPVLLSQWAGECGTAGAREIQGGTFYELAQVWQAGEDYRGWMEDPHCFEHRRHLIEADRALVEAEKRGAETGLLEMGWKHLLHCSYETSWHDPNAGYSGESGNSGRARRLAGWVAALMSHARTCSILAIAAEWFTQRDKAAHAELADIDGDGEPELVLKNGGLFAVFSPRFGGRLIYLFDLTGPSGRLVIGNTSDDWNLQEELNRYMDRPRNHPGALVDVGHEHDRYEAVILGARGQTASVSLRNIEFTSPLLGLEKQLSLNAGDAHISVRYILPQALWRLSTEVCFSPDYHRMLRHGRTGIFPFNGPDWRGWGNGSARVWLRIDPFESVIWDKPYQPDCGHGLNIRVTSFSRDFHAQLGVGTVPQQSRRKKSDGELERVGTCRE